MVPRSDSSRGPWVIIFSYFFQNGQNKEVAGGAPGYACTCIRTDLYGNIGHIRTGAYTV